MSKREEGILSRADFTFDRQRDLYICPQGHRQPLPGYARFVKQPTPVRFPPGRARFSMLKEIAPSLARAALMANPKTGTYDYFLRAAETVAPSLAIKLVSSPVETAADVERAIESFAGGPDGGLLLPPDSTTILHRDLIIALAARHRLPAVYPFHFFVTGGGLMSYGTDQLEMFRLAASYVDRILHGDKPSDLPVQAPTKFQTVVNLKTAKALGLTVPPGLLVAADEVIE
jgi:putative tryptophan/tyrosine transport system substrate-binding protein